MGDIIWGTFLIILVLGLFGLYRFNIRKSPEKRSFRKFLSLLILLGGAIGMLATGLNERLLHDHPYQYALTLLFFVTQTAASLLYFREVKAGLALLALTLLLQVPILRLQNLSYTNQTLFSLRLENLPKTLWDIEPGSYIHFMYFKLDRRFIHLSTTESSYGVNLIPLFSIAMLWRKKKKTA